MNFLRTKLRWLVIPALVLGLAGTGVSSCFDGGAGCGRSALKSPKSPICRCCKGTCHGQCGMACCQKPASGSDQLPIQPKSHEDSGPSLGLVSAIPTATDFASAGASQDGMLELTTASACPSLLALNIRFN